MSLPPYVSIGRHTYSANIGFMRWADEKIVIGNFCSISQAVKIMAGGNHRTDTVSTFPFDTVLMGRGRAGEMDRSYERGGDIEIGSDVWIGYGATLTGSMKIGHGAVISAGAQVFTDIPPYGIAVGNPARVTKFRFPEEIVDALLRIAWWEWPDEMMKSCVDHFYAPIEDFVSTFDNRYAMTHAEGMLV